MPSSFTPGPWKDYTPLDSMSWRHGVRGSPGCICVMPGWESHDHLRQEQEANHRLILAAPLLLEALVQAAGALQGAAECMRKIDAPKTAARLEEVALASLLVVKEATGSGS